MKAFNYDMFERLELPQIILSTKYHEHLGTINNIDKESINATFNLNSAQEISFDIYKEMDGVKCELWDKIIDLKYIFVPDYQEYYSISVSIDEDNKVVKHIVGTSACEYELAHRKLYNFECNTEADIAPDDYVPTVLYNPNNTKASLLHRVLKDKCPDYKIGHVDSSIANKQRVFSANDQDIYSFLTNDIATELECIFIFNSVNRVISVYEIKTYGENTGVFISPENYADSITVEGDAENVFNCLKIEGGDELMTATVANLNPNGSNYIYHFSEDMLNDMPEELVEKIASYNELSATLQPTYEEYTEKIYELIDEELYLTSEMMPEVTTPETTADAEATNLVKNLKSVEVPNINSVSKTSSDSAVKGMAQVIIDPRYDINIDSSTLSSVSSNKRTWSGIITITNKGDEEDTATTSQFSVTIKSDDYEAYLYQKIQKALDRDDSVFYTIFEIEDISTFKAELKKYSLNRLKSFESSYQTCLDVLIEQGITTDTTKLYGVNLYETMYKPYYNRIVAIQAEMVIREKEIINVQKEHTKYEKLRYNIQKQLDFKKYIGDNLWIIFSHYRVESTYKNDNYISEGLDNKELIKLASELFERGKEETIKASELQYSLTASLNNLLNTKEFKPFKNKINMGNWINLEADGIIYKLRLINLGINYGSLDEITVSFSDVFRCKQLGIIEDTKSILEQAKNMANSYDYVAHQANQGNDANANIKDWLKDGLSSALIAIKNNDNQEITYNEHGLWAKSYDPITDSYSPEQLRVTHNILCYTTDAWQTVSLAIGKHNYTYYNETTKKFTTATDFGVSAKFLTAGYIYGSQIIGGDIYSDNYSSTSGSHINLRTGGFTLASNKLVYNPTTNNLTIKDVNIDWSSTTTPEISDINGLEDDLISMSSRISVNEKSITTEVARATKSEGNLSSKIEQTADSIISTVSQTYETKSNANSEYKTLQSSITQTADSIISTVSKTYETKSNANSKYTTLESSITQNAENIELKVSKTDFTGKTIASKINQSATTVVIEAGHIKLEGLVTANDNFKVLTDGSIEAKNGSFTGTVNATDGSFTGKITSTSGNIAGWTLSSKAFYKGTNSLSSTTSGTYLGIDGIRQYANADSYTNIIGGKITTNNIDISGGNINLVGDSWEDGRFTIQGGSYKTVISSGVIRTSRVSGGGIVTELELATGDVHIHNYSNNYKTSILIGGQTGYFLAKDIHAYGSIRVNHTNGTPIKLIKCGTAVLTGNGTNSKELVTLAFVRSFCSDANANNTAIFIDNADGVANGLHTHGTSYQSDTQSWSALFDRTTSSAVRINFTIIVWDA